MPPSARMEQSEDQYLPPQTQKLKQQVNHIVVLMLENRSFDNLLGWLYHDQKPARGQSFAGLQANLWNPLDNYDADGHPFSEKVVIRKNGKPFKIGGRNLPAKEVDFTLPSPDPGEGYADTNYQLYGTYDVNSLYPPEPTGQGFVNNYKNAMLYGTYAFHSPPSDPREIMTAYTPDQTPVLSTLALEYAVCDQWFASIPSQTLPNRSFVHAATSCGQVNNRPTTQYPCRTIFNQIQDAHDQGQKDLSWKVYSGIHKDKKLQKWTPFSLTRLCMTEIQDPKFDANFCQMNEFYQDAKAGNLPSYSFIEPQFSGPNQNDQHPPIDIRPGEQLMADIYNAIKHSPNFNETLFIITYDEHGGCYDHLVPTGWAHPPEEDAPAGQMGFRFNRFGVRVPTVVISPLIEKGTIARPKGWVPYDHTSFIKTVQVCFDLEHLGPLTNRDRHAPDLSGLLTLDHPRRVAPDVAPLSFPPAQRELVNDLHHLAADILAGKLKIQKPEEQELHGFIEQAYREAFGSKAKE